MYIKKSKILIQFLHLFYPLKSSSSFYISFNCALKKLPKKTSTQNRSSYVRHKNTIVIVKFINNSKEMVNEKAPYLRSHEYAVNLSTEWPLQNSPKG